MLKERPVVGTAGTQPVALVPNEKFKPRLFYIDNLRVGLITLVIVGHIAITYGAPISNWYYREEGEAGLVFSILAMLLLGIGASFLLGLFFMISGYFTPRTYDRKGAGPFILDRFKRLGIPLVLYAFIINPLVTYWAALAGGYQGSFWQYAPSHIPELSVAAVGPLWFVEALLVFSILYAIGRIFFKGNSMVVSEEQGRVPALENRSIVVFALGLSLATYVVRLFWPVGWWWEPPHQELAHFPQYIAFFAVGILAYRYGWFERVTSAQARPWRWIALVLVPLLPVLAVASGVLSGEPNTEAAGGFTWLSLAYSLWEGFMGTAMVMIMLVWFRDRFNRQGWLVKQMSSASYAVYVLHPLVIVPLAIALSGIQMSLDLKFILVAPLAVALSFLIGFCVQRLPLVRHIL